MLKFKFSNFANNFKIKFLKFQFYDFCINNSNKRVSSKPNLQKIPTNPIIQKLDILIDTSDMEFKKEFLMSNFNLDKRIKGDEFTNNKKYSNFISQIFSAPFGDKKLKILVKQILPELGIEEKKRLVTLYKDFKKLPQYIILDLLNDILKINEKPEVSFIDSNNILSILIYFCELEKEYLKSIQDEILKLIESFTKNFYKFSLNDRNFLKIFWNLFLLEKKSEEITFLSKNQNFTEEFYNLFTNYLLENFNKIENSSMTHLSFIFDQLDKNFYKNDKLLIKLLEKICQNDLNIDEKDKSIVWNNITYPILNSKILLKVQKHQNLSSLDFNTFLELAINYYNSEFKKDKNMHIRKSSFAFRNVAFLHSVIQNDLKIKELLEPVSSLLNNYLNLVYDSLIMKNIKFDIHTNNKIMIMLYKPLVYAKSIKLNVHKVDELLEMITEDKFMDKLFNTSIISDFHKDFLRFLISLKINYSIEDRQDYFSKDIVLTGHKICIELDGIKHFYRDGDVKYNTIIKRHILNNFGWKVINVNHADWQKLKEKEKLEFVRTEIRRVIE
jgi:very-short-patch-repair endonuclease